MTTPITNVLIVGRSQLVLDTTVALLKERGYHASATNNFENITDQIDAKNVKLVVFGGQVPPNKKTEMRDALSADNPHVEFIQGLSGIPGLIADQVEAALNGEVLIPGQAPAYDLDKQAINLSLYAPLDVKVTVYWITELVPPDPKSDSVVVAEKSLPAGEHRFAIPDTVDLNAAFATVHAGGAFWSFRLLPAAS